MITESDRDRIANELTEALFAKYDGRLTEQQLAVELNRMFAKVRETLPSDVAENLITRFKGLWFDLSPERN